jgi:hypothetical protein
LGCFFFIINWYIGDGAAGPAADAARAGDLSSPASTPLEQACADLAAALCARLQSCAPLARDRRYGDAVTCGARVRLACQVAASAPGARATPAALSTCARSLPSAACGAVATEAALDECFPAGSREDGRPCGTSSQCASGYCRLTGPSCGACGPRLAAGDPCTESAQCRDRLVCSDQGLCVAPAAVEATCSPTSRPCEAHLACAGGVCLIPGAEGGACTDDECGPLSGLWCDRPLGASRGQCRRMERAEAGARCGAMAGTVVVCTAGARCQPGADGLSRCMPPGDDGGGCGDDAQGRGCLAPAACRDRVCLLPASCGA